MQPGIRLHLSKKETLPLGTLFTNIKLLIILRRLKLILLKNYIIENFKDVERFSINERYLDINGKNLHEECLFIGDFEELRCNLCDFSEFALCLFDDEAANELLYALTSIYDDDFTVEPDFLLNKNIYIKKILINERS